MEYGKKIKVGEMGVKKIYRWMIVDVMKKPAAEKVWSRVFMGMDVKRMWTNMGIWINHAESYERFVQQSNEKKQSPAGQKQTTQMQMTLKDVGSDQQEEAAGASAGDPGWEDQDHPPKKARAGSLLDMYQEIITENDVTNPTTGDLALQPIVITYPALTKGRKKGIPVCELSEVPVSKRVGGESERPDANDGEERREGSQEEEEEEEEEGRRGATLRRSIQAIMAFLWDSDFACAANPPSEYEAFFQCLKPSAVNAESLAEERPKCRQA
ncbi:hypothetical protein D9C73_000174 [Collichthys lucidus]|uniref:Uncharacterized protein n=1 Tax=Collichthys lucidus TaxID=240159 RepID=A0A4U5TXV2_COLLU|nr:hypothetical protein D9C73_000174 [Collichthys lucidus]